MSVFLTPTLQPFVAGTYFPLKDMYGRPGFKTLLRRITEAWQSKKDDIKAQSEDSMEQLVSLSVLEGAVRPPPPPPPPPAAKLNPFQERNAIGLSRASHNPRLPA